MLEFRIEELVGQSSEQLARRIENFGGDFRVHLMVRDLYVARSPIVLAHNWLKMWCTAELLADSATTAKCEYREGALGVGHFTLDLTSEDHDEMAAALLNFASAYDEDDLEAMCFVHDTADEWLEKRHDAPAWFPNLEKHYRENADVSAEWAKSHPDVDDN